jgi:hypothetical protein
VKWLTRRAATLGCFIARKHGSRNWRRGLADLIEQSPSRPSRAATGSSSTSTGRTSGRMRARSWRSRPSRLRGRGPPASHSSATPTVRARPPRTRSCRGGAPMLSVPSWSVSGPAFGDQCHGRRRERVDRANRRRRSRAAQPLRRHRLPEREAAPPAPAPFAAAPSPAPGLGALAARRNEASKGGWPDAFSSGRVRSPSSGEGLPPPLPAARDACSPRGRPLSRWGVCTWKKAYQL